MKSLFRLAVLASTKKEPRDDVLSQDSPPGEGTPGLNKSVWPTERTQSPAGDRAQRSR